MKLLPLSLLLLLCPLDASVSDRSSLTFIDLISGVISNARFIEEENLDHWKSLENATWPKIDLTRAGANLNESNCSRDLQTFARDLATRQTWALKSKMTAFVVGRNSSASSRCSDGRVGKTAEWRHAWESLLDRLDRRMPAPSARFE